jgi:hypothetical protein
MFLSKYPTINDFINRIKNDDKLKIINNISTLNENKCNVLFIHDYQVTCKIDKHELNTDIPISRNSNTIILKNVYASYIYYIVIYLLTSCNYNQCYTLGEFYISSDIIYNLSIELDNIMNCISKNNNYGDPLDEFKELFKDLLDNNFDDNKYNYLLGETILEEEECIKSDNLDQSEDNTQTNTKTDSGTDSETDSGTDSDSNKLEQIEDTYTEQYNKEIYMFDELNVSDTDSEYNNIKKSHEIISNIKTNLVNILESKN